ncbi:hypothetical protein NKI79_20015 [Mesorhizobium sp. M0340]|uniref:hypothetical protein n=1 Tax=Mesorhizobium sp. M0340 TaxID=2956939 RepID=UPI0033368AFA
MLIASTLSRCDRSWQRFDRHGFVDPHRVRAVIDAEANEIDAARARRLQLKLLASWAVSLCDGLRGADRFREGATDFDHFLLGGSTRLARDMAGREADEPTGSLDSDTSDEIRHCSGAMATAKPSSGSASIEFADPAGRQITLHDARSSTTMWYQATIRAESHEVAPNESSGEPANSRARFAGSRAPWDRRWRRGTGERGQFSPDQQNGATPEERSRIGENHAMNSE